MDLIELCRQAIRIDSTPSQGNMAFSKWASEVANSLGFEVEILMDSANGLEQANLIVKPRHGATPNSLLLQSHLDTHDPGPYQIWTHNFQNPFEAIIKENTLFGLGASDGKIDFICKLLALHKFHLIKNWKLSPILIGTFGGHTGMQGALRLIRKNKIQAKMGIVFDATQLRMAVNGPGFTVVEIKIPFSSEELIYREEHNLRESTSTQSKLFVSTGDPTDTESSDEGAIIKMFHYLDQLPGNLVILEVDGGANPSTLATNAFLELDFMTVSDPMSLKLNRIFKEIRNIESHSKAVNPTHSVKINLGLIRTHSDHVVLQGQCKLPPVATQKSYEDWMSQMKQAAEHVKGQFQILDYKKPFFTSENHALVRSCQSVLEKMNLNFDLISTSSTNEASLFSRIGIDCVCFGPGKQGNNVLIPSLHQSIQFYENIIERLCL